MADLILAWYVDGELSPKAGVGPTYRVDTDYTPVRVTLVATQAPRGNLRVDINADGVSIFAPGEEPVLTYLEAVATFTERFTTSKIKEGTLLTLDIDDEGSLRAWNSLTVQLDLNAGI